MADMTLEQVANELRITARHGASLAPQTCHYLADAIDAAIRERDRLRGDVAGMTEEMVERARSAFVQADDGSTGITDAIRAALLAAQNPND